MNASMNDCMREAMRLMKAGELRAATAAIQAQLDGGELRAGHDAAPMPAAAVDRAPLDGEFVVVDEPPRDRTIEAPARENPAGGADPRPAPRVQRRSFRCDAGSRDYVLFVPTAYRGQALPLVVMLHGCTQTPEDFARGTRMNALAEEHGCLVVYPAQSKSHNGTNCWNWFKPSDQRRDRGEPAIIAGMARAIVDEFKLDGSRVYVAGLSAGAAMAVILGNEYPDVFGAIGVHSGLPYASAHDVKSAFAAMHGNGRTSAGSPLAAEVAQPASAAIPSIVFHGDRDTTVTPANGDAVTSESIARLRSAAVTGDAANALSKSVEAGKRPGGRSYTRTTYADASGIIVAEHWVIHGAGHAWSGGHGSGSYTDPQGPDASAEMLRFFLRISRANRAR